MNATARDILHRLADLGAKVERRGDKLLLEAGTAPVPSHMLTMIREHKAEVLKAITEDAERGDFEERAALVEEGAKVPRAWAEGFAKLCTMPLPEGVPLRRWQQLIDNAGRFIDLFARQAHSLGWDTASVFRCHRAEPDARFEVQGLVWRIGDGELVMITETTAQIRKPSGNVLTFRRRAPDPREPMAMVWELPSADGNGNAE